jgi:hypothetical protein
MLKLHLILILVDDCISFDLILFLLPDDYYFVVILNERKNFDQIKFLDFLQIIIVF